MPQIQGTHVGPGAYSPLITVELSVAGQKARGPAVVDSGAFTTIIPAELIEGHPTLSWDQLSPFPHPGIGAGGSFEIREVAGDAFWRDIQFCFGKLHVAAPNCLDTPLLGMNDFFKRFIVKFNWNRDPPSMRIDEVTGKRF